MANVSFNEEPTPVTSMSSAKKPLLVRTVLATGIVRTDKQAQYVLMGIAALAIIAAIFMWPKGRPQPDINGTVPVAGPSDVRQ